MKRIVCIILIICAVCALTACSGKTVASGTTETSVPEEKTSKTEQVDIDLCEMGSTMVYAEVQNMMTVPDSYVGKTVRMAGKMSVAEVNGNRYFACIIADATACCSQGIEFDWEGEHSYPDDYPSEGEEITVVGTFSTYMEGDLKYCQLKNAELTF